MKISVCVIVKNEEKYIKQCIESVYAIAYEIIVLDTGSIDKTKEIVRKFDKVKLFETTWKDDFSLARNQCISYASGDWILSIDADEILFSSSEKVLELLDTNAINTIFRFKSVSILDYNLEKSYFKDSLFPNNKDYRFFRPIHEQLDIKDLNEINTEDIVLHHFGELETTEKLINKKTKYITKMEKLLETSNDFDKMHYLRFLGETYSELNNHVKALEKYTEAYNLIVNHNFQDSEDCKYVLQGLLSHLILENKPVAYKLIEHAYKFDWDNLNYLTGLYYVNQKQYHMAKDIFNHLLNKKISQSFKSNIFLQLGKIESNISNYKALKFFLESEACLPTNLETITEILKIYVNQNNLPKSIEYFLKLNPNSEFKNELLELVKIKKNAKEYKKSIGDLEKFLLELGV